MPGRIEHRSSSRSSFDVKYELRNFLIIRGSTCLHCFSLCCLIVETFRKIVAVWMNNLHVWLGHNFGTPLRTQDAQHCSGAQPAEEFR